MKRPLIVAILVTISLIFTGSILAAPLTQEQKPTIAEPKADAAVRGVVQIVGSATHPQFQRYDLRFATWPPSADDQGWVVIGEAHYQQQPLGLLGTWDSRTVPDGDYALKVRVIKVDGNFIDSIPRRVMVANKRAIETITPLPTFSVLETPTAAPTPTLAAAPTIAAPRPATATPQPEATPILQLAPGSGTPAPASSELFSAARLLEIAKKSATYTVAAFAAIGAFFAVKWLLAWLWHKIRP